MGVTQNGVPIGTTSSLALFRYEPFSYTFAGDGDDTVSLVSASTLVRTLVTTSGSDIVFASSGYTGTISTTESIVLVTSPGNVTYTINISLSPGRFTAPVLTSIALNKNTSVATTYGSAIVFTSPIAISPPTITPALPFGLSFVPIDSRNYALTGTPVAIAPTTSYTVYGFGLVSSSQVVTKIFTITIADEALNLSIDGTSNLPALTIGTPIPDRSITAVYPLSGPSNLYYTWSNLPDGIVFTDYLGNPRTSPFYPVDENSTITLVGNPTLTAAQSFVTAGSSNRTVRVRATRVAPTALTADICLGFTFGPTVLFTSSSNIALYSGDDINLGQAVVTARTFFDPANTPMSLIAAYTLPTGVSLSYTPGSSNAFLTGTPTVAGSNVYTFTADNSNGVTRDASINIVVSNDVVAFTSTSPSNNTTYNFVISRPLNQGLTGYYPSSFLYSATAASTLTDISYSITNVPSGLAISTTSSGLTLTGIPNAVTSLTSSTITALSIHTGVTATRTLNWAVLNDDISITSPTSTLTFFQNQAITPLQFAGTTLSERIITSWTSGNLPAGLSLSTSGRLSGTPTGFTIGTSTFDVTASTGFVPESNPFTYQIIKDDVLIALVRDPTTVSEQFSGVEFRIITYSGLAGTANVSVFFPLQPSSATLSFSGNSLSGDFTQVDALLPQYRFRLTGTVGEGSGGGDFLVTVTNPNTQRRFVLDVSSTTGFVTPPPTFVFPKGVLTLYSNGASLYSFTGPNTITCNSPSNWGVAFSTSNSVYGNIGDIAQSSNTVVLVNSSNLYRSADGGAQWSLVSDISTIPGIVGGYQNVPPFGIFTTAGPILTTVTSGGGSNWLALGVGYDSNVSGAARTILRTSSNDGLTWTDASLSPAFVENSTDSRLYYNQSRYFLAQSNTTSTTYRANASNLSVWTGASSGMPNFTGNIARAFDFSNSTVLAGGDGTPPLYKSSDNGTTWMPVAVGAATSVRDIRYRGGKWYLATDAGVYTSTDAMTFTLADATVVRGIDFDGASFNAVYPTATPPAAATLTIPYDTSMGAFPFAGTTNMNTREMKRMMTRIIDNGPGLLQISSMTTSSTFVVPTKRTYTFLQYAGVNIPVQVSPTSNFIYYYAADLPRGLRLALDTSGISADVSGTPSQYSAGFTPFLIFARDTVNANLTTLSIDARVISPFVMKKQSGAAAYTAFLRQYVTVNGAQSSRDSVALPTSNYGIGEFMRPGAPMVETDSNCPC